MVGRKHVLISTERSIRDLRPRECRAHESRERGRITVSITHHVKCKVPERDLQNEVHYPRKPRSKWAWQVLPNSQVGPRRGFVARQYDYSEGTLPLAIL